MKNYSTIIFFFLFLINLNSQSGTISYSVKVTDKVFKTKEESKAKNYITMMNEAANAYQDNFNYHLTFNENESEFKCLEVMDNENNSLKIRFAKIIFHYKTVFYTNAIKNKKIEQTFAYGEYFRISDSISSKNWTLLKEKKEINGFLCYKAKTVKTIINSKGTFKKDVIAWYAPQLPYNFGPNGYCGLPGLILELNDDKLSYYATKINVDNKKSVEINEPFKGKLMTAEEFQKFSLGLDVSFD